jgi:hypothetical protein
VSYVDAGYSIALGILFLYAVALVLRRRRWERALRVVERDEQAQHTQPTVRVAEPTEVAKHVEHVEHVEEQAAPGARS